MLITTFPAGPWGTNCYVLATGTGAECVIVDPGMGAADGVAQILTEHRLRPVAVMLTHGHIDHMFSVVPVAQGYRIPALVHQADRHLLANPSAGMSPETRTAIERMIGPEGFVEPDEVREFATVPSSQIDLAGMTWQVEHAPGHTPGSVTFGLAAVDGSPSVLLSGDVLFAGSIGRTDLPGGDTEAMMRSLERVVLSLDDSTMVLPGHGAATTVGEERRTNPYLRDLQVHTPPPPRRGL